MASSSAYRLIILPEAVDEIADLHSFYEKINPDLGDRFMDKLGDCFNDILDNPGRFQYVRSYREGIRRGLLDAPPVIFLYRVVNTDVRILTVRDARSDWKK